MGIHSGASYVQIQRLFVKDLCQHFRRQVGEEADNRAQLEGAPGAAPWWGPSASMVNRWRRALGVICTNVPWSVAPA